MIFADNLLTDAKHKKIKQPYNETNNICINYLNLMKLKPDSGAFMPSGQETNQA